MAQVQCIRIPLHPDHAEEFLTFARSLPQRREQVVEVLREEGMLAEAVILQRGPEGLSLILFTKAEDLAAAHAALQRSDHPIQRTMRELSTRAFVVEKAETLEVLLDMTGPFEA